MSAALILYALGVIYTWKVENANLGRWWAVAIACVFWPLTVTVWCVLRAAIEIRDRRKRNG